MGHIDSHGWSQSEIRRAAAEDCSWFERTGKGRGLRSLPGEFREQERPYRDDRIAQLRLVDLAKRANAVVHNISSDGAFFLVKMVLDEGRPVQLLIDWPVRLDGRIPLSLVLEGMVIRSDWPGPL